MDVCAENYGVIQPSAILHHFLHIYMYEHVIIINLCLLSSGAEHSYDLPPLVKGFNNHINHLIHSRLLLHNINAFHSPKETHQVFLFAKTSLLLQYPWLRLNDGTNHIHRVLFVHMYNTYIHIYMRPERTKESREDE